MAQLAVIGGTGLTQLSNLKQLREKDVETPYGPPSSPIRIGQLGGNEIAFLARHGDGHTIPPHKVNYRANIWALKSLGFDHILAVAAVGGIGNDMGPGELVIPDQIVDYTYGREQTFFSDGLDHVTHIDFTEPYCAMLRLQIQRAIETSGSTVTMGGVYGATQGPRLESAAEIRRMQRDGCDLVGMTGMPEAALARELELCYATCCVVANWAAGLSEGPITMEEIEQTLVDGMARVRSAIESLAESI